MVVSLEKSLDFKNLDLRLIDFGLASLKRVDDSDEIVGTPYYIAPEIIKGEIYGTKCDIWSLGVLTYFLITKKYPFDSDDRDDLYRKIENREFQFEGEMWDKLN